MTNREKYTKEIVDIVCNGGRVAVENGKPQNCDKITDCVKCDLRKDGVYCRKEFKKWCNEEYGEPQVDWSKVPIDMPILVRDDENENWVKRHFACYKNGVIYAYDGGKTSWTCALVTAWKYAELVAPDDLIEHSIMRKCIAGRE